MRLIMIELHADRPDDVERLQRLLEAAPEYSRLVTGAPPASDAGKHELTALPDGINLEDKHFIGFRLDGAPDELIGCADVIHGYPNADTAYIGLLLFAERYQGRGLGQQAFQIIEQMSRDWACRRIRLGVIATNTAAFKFWQRLGFVECERKSVAGFVAEAVVMEYKL